MDRGSRKLISLPPCRASLAARTKRFSAASLSWGLILVSCVSGNRAIIMPPQVPGATFVGSKACVQCHQAKHLIYSVKYGFEVDM